MEAGAAKIQGVAKRSRRQPEAPPAGVLARAGRAIKAGWLKFAALLAKVNGAILLTVIYFLVIAPINLLSRVVRADLMEKRIGEDPSFWKEPEGPSRSLEDSRKQF
ncbi:MAG: hypothetical protein Q8R92_19120 [Deltaproteobacteria bacterium]|nr:hypothetical protein [Deltaproteobacteria bacterium]